MAKFIDLTGQKFGRLTVMSIAKKKRGNGVYWLCKCECGNTTIVKTASLKNGTSKSCGCLQKDILKTINTKHSLSNNKLYYVLRGMKYRCYNEKSKAYKHYGERGIKICDEWLDNQNGLINFYTWSINNGYKEGLSIDRIDVNGNYEPSNCRWVTSIEQLNNTRRNHFITYNGETHTISEWCRISNIPETTLRKRLWRGWSIDRAFNTPVHTKK